MMFIQSVAAQKTTYYTKDGNVSGKKKADYYKIVTQKDNDLWKTQQFHIDGRLMFEGYSHHKDGSDKEGTYKSYYPSGILKKQSIYADGNILETDLYYESTMLERKTLFSDRMITSVHNYYESGKLKDEVFYSGSKEERNITVKSFFEDGNLKRNEEYLDVKNEFGEREYQLVQSKCFAEDGTEVSYTPFLRYPRFPGGDRALRLFIQKNLKYPKDAQKQRIHGRVYVQFLVCETGEVQKVKIAKSVYYALDNEALRVVKSMPDWTPGISYGQVDDISYTLPINFRLR